MTSNRLSGKCALVTGAAGGIGQAIVEQLRSEGVQVAVTDRITDGLAADFHLPRHSLAVNVEAPKILPAALELAGACSKKWQCFR